MREKQIYFLSPLLIIEKKKDCIEIENKKLIEKNKIKKI